MRPIDRRIEPLLAYLAQDPKLPEGAEDNIRQAIAESPYLSNLLADAVANKQIGRIAVSHGEHNGGHFEDGEKGQPGTLYVSDANFKDWDSKERIDLLTEVMGHETMHGVLAQTRAHGLNEFSTRYQTAMEEAYQARETSVNLTEPVRTYLDKGRQDEALAEISGLLALNSRLKHEIPGASAAELERALAERSKSRCVENTASGRDFSPGLSYEAFDQASLSKWRTSDPCR